MDASELVFLLAGRVSRSCYVYLQAAVELVTQDSGYLVGVTKSLYPELGKKFGASARAIDRAISRAVADCWDQGNRSLLEQIARRPLYEKPSPKDFLYIVSHYLREENGKEP